MIQTKNYFISAIIMCCPCRLYIGKNHLKIRFHKRGLCLKKDCIMNMTALHHDYKEGCIVTFLRGGGGIILI